MTNMDKQIISAYINRIYKIIEKYHNYMLDNKLLQKIQNEINQIKDSYKNRILNLIFTILKYENNYLICYIGIEEHMYISKEVNNYIKECINARYFLNNI